MTTFGTCSIIDLLRSVNGTRLLYRILRPCPCYPRLHAHIAQPSAELAFHRLKPTCLIQTGNLKRRTRLTRTLTVRVLVVPNPCSLTLIRSRGIL
jgi:hypothetical protein